MTEQLLINVSAWRSDMAHSPVFGLIRAAKASAWPAPLPVPARPERVPHRLSYLLPAQPAAIPIHADEKPATASRSCPLPLQRKLEVGSTTDPLETEAEAMAARVLGSTPAGAASQVLHRRATTAIQPVEVPHIVHDELRSPGCPLDAETRAFMEPRFGRDLSSVRIHTGLRADESARAVHALAYTVGQDAVFAAGLYNPHTAEGKRLLAHELSHTVQQAGGSGSAPPAHLSSAAPALQRQPDHQDTPHDPSKDKPKTGHVAITLPWNDLLHLRLTPPSLLAPKQQRPLLPSPGTLTLGGTTGGATPNPYAPPFGFSPPLTPSSTSPLQQPTLPGISSISPSSPTSPSPLAPTPSKTSGAPAGASPSAPSRLSVHDFGPLSIGLRLGFPDMKTDTKPGMPPSAAQQSLQQAEILAYLIDGKVPSAYTLDKGKLAGAIWGIFSTYIAPDLAHK
ncbi:MAG TPA: DUF4157 domain-containing protein, partial [Terracidiphilus sp.]|nr:DUF4157 domain-containing protein [Terracidiphilus sp.]